MKKQKRLMNQKGFTLIELVVVMGIFGFLVATLFLVFFQFRNLVLLSGSVKQMQDILLSARRNAIDNVVPTDYPAAGIEGFYLNYYEVRVDLSGDDYFTRAYVTDLSSPTTISSYFPLAVGGQKKGEYDAIDIQLDENSPCNSANVSGSVLYVTFDALTGEIHFYDGPNKNNGAGDIPIDSCTLLFTYTGRERRVVIDRSERTFELQ